jgi:putative flippase GtrA
MIDRFGDRRVLARFIRFGMVGALSTLLYGVFTELLIRGNVAEPVAASALGYVLTTPLNYLLQRTFAFRSGGSFRPEIGRYLAVHGGNIVGSVAIMHLVTGVFDTDYRIGIALTMTLVPIAVFLLLDRWVFRPSP